MKEFNDNNHKLSDLIRTTRSDESYPWPPGKAPRTVERGGSGTPPDRARENFGKNSYGALPEQEWPRRAEGESEAMGQLLAAGLVSAPSSREEAEKMMEVGRKWVTMATEFSGSSVGERNGSH
eukprot:GFUD01039144.1.p1 GENE.GFUD01039144.1~~GFUD01039144.1.p1  ORF type:complete len:123 (+),score=41.85 GFUD01039144.1:1-369(+)